MQGHRGNHRHDRFSTIRLAQLLGRFLSDPEIWILQQGSKEFDAPTQSKTQHNCAVSDHSIRAL